MRRILAFVVVLVVLGACGTGEDGAGSSDGRPEVVAAFYPLFEAAQRVGGDLVRVHNLTPAGTEPHDLELNSRQIDRVEDAAVVLFLGRGFQPALERAAERAEGTKVDVLAESGALLPAPEGDDDLDADPHVWLDPTLQKRVVERVVPALSEVDPANRATYEANGAAYGRELDELDTAFSQGLAQCTRRTFVTSHAAFGYLARRYDLTQEAIAGLEPDAEPSPRRMAELAQMVQDDGITTIFYETLASPAVAESLAREAGVRTAVLDPLEGLSEEDGRAGKTYVSVMRENLAALRTALGCT
ncbi:MAG: metal ABC transporter substrate-binding protein [Acidimicrobiia bacterium]